MTPKNQNESRRKPRWAKRIGKSIIFLLGVVALIGLGVILGYFAKSYSSEKQAASQQGDRDSSTTAEDGEDVTWTCSMHPQVSLPEKGKCPICFMDLIPKKETEDASGDPWRLTMSEAAVEIAEIQTTPVIRKYATQKIRLFGKVDYDETRVADITAWVRGRIEELFVDYTGIAVRKDDHMAELYSPELIVAQRELLQARRLEEKFQGEDPSFGKTTLENAREKLRLLGVQPHQIESLLERGTPSETLTIYAPQSGIVIDKLAKEGQYVDEGTVIYNLADLSVVWVYLDAYESDIAWLRYGQKVELTTKSYPGKIIEGRIAFIKPMLNDPTRTVRVRVNVPNEKGWLKPGMFVQAVVESRLDAHGDVYDPTLVGKWISPMHPEIVKDGPGKCDVCGMDLVPASSLGYSVPEKRPPKPLLIPDTAPLLTGKRAVVYVEVPDQDTPTYQGREVTLGPRANDRFIVETGLEEGEHVVTNGSFKLDSELQIRARPSMMTLEEEALPPMPELRVDASFLEQLRPLVSDYIDLQEALASDDLAASKKAAEQFHDTFGKVEGEGLLTGEPLLAWRDVRAMLRGALEVEFTEMSMTELRQKFETLSFAMIELVEVFGNPLEEPLREAYCPMAFNNQGAPWLQVREEIFNSYFGSQMLKCGEIRQTFPPFATSRDSKRREER